jgi:phosphoribosylformylglycinamidine synthase
MDYEKRVHTAIREVIAQGLAQSSHDVGEGGLAIALAECCAEGIGASITFDTGMRPEFALFHEGPSRILVSTSQPEAVETIARDNNIECLRLGVTMKEKLQISNSSLTKASPWIDCRVEHLREVWENALENLLSPVSVG